MMRIVSYYIQRLNRIEKKNITNNVVLITAPWDS